MNMEAHTYHEGYGLWRLGLRCWVRMFHEDLRVGTCGLMVITSSLVQHDYVNYEWKRYLFIISFMLSPEIGLSSD
ncbi:MAG: hypothetical protein DRN15_10455 [Thermoprotei archaeon]|nr:MAG: hypothetical protein DRN15_10455 [Thermoprotei archaeon]RLF24333.1 MAG: hypothetical protein DRM97_03570 [Thermoprotei archaeon]